MLNVLRFDSVLQAAKDFLGRLGDRILSQRIFSLADDFLVPMPQDRTRYALD